MGRAAKRTGRWGFFQVLAAGAMLVFVALAATSAEAQTGRTFVSAEAFAGAARILYIGKIVRLERIEYDKPLMTYAQKVGKPYRLVFEVSETIRGPEVKRLELVLSLQITIYLECMRDHSVEIMLVGGPTRLDHYPAAEVGIEEQGAAAEGQWYQFRILEPVEVPASDPHAEIVEMLNQYYDSCRMFTHQFEIVSGKQAILQRVRAFVKRHPEPLRVTSVRVPNEFGALVGCPNAYCHITLPVCPETKATLEAMKSDPGPILRQIKAARDKRPVEPRDDGGLRSLLVTEFEKSLSQFPPTDGKTTDGKTGD